MTQIERRVPKGLRVHVILDHYATHKTPDVAAWLRHHPRVHFHCTPTSASWLNLVERFFSELEQAIREYIARRNTDPTPFTWTASVPAILAKVKKANDTLASLH